MLFTKKFNKKTGNTVIMMYSNLCFEQLSHNIGALIFAFIFLLAGCDNSTSTEESEPQITDALILLNGSNDGVTIEAGETVKFTGYALTESGEQIPFDELGDQWSWEWQSTNPAIFTVDTQGSATGEEKGKAYCVITLNRPEEGAGTRASNQGDLSKVVHANSGRPEINRIFVGRDSLSVAVKLK